MTGDQAETSDGNGGGPRGARAPVFRAALAAWAAMLGASLANFLHYQAYPMVRAEVGIFAAWLLLLAAVMAGVHALLGRRGRALMVALLLFVAVDINADLLWLAALLAAVAGIAAWRGADVLRFLTIAFVVVLGTALVGLGGRAEGVKVSNGRMLADPGPLPLPLVVQVILDEQAGPAGLAPGEAAWLEQRYRAMGFSVYAQGYSRHYHTKNSLAELIHGLPQGGRGLGLQVRRMGYRNIFVTQTDFYSLCKRFAAVRCTTYSASSLEALAGQPIGAAGKADVLAYHFGGLSTLTRKITNAYDKLARRAGWTSVELRSVRKVPQMNAVEMVPRIEAELAEARRGEYHVVHLLLPHAPYSYDASCTMRPTRAWRAERQHAPLAERDAAYALQMRCATAVVERLVAAVGRSPGGKDAVILVHGDHGSRIVTREPAGEKASKASDDDFTRGFATLIAARLPGQPARLIDGPAALTDVVPALAASGFTALPAPKPGPAWVNIGYRAWTPVERRDLPVWKLPQSGGREPQNHEKP